MEIEKTDQKDYQRDDKDIQARFKFNSGNSALCCSGCNVIIKIGLQFNDNEILAIRGKKHLDPQYCKECKYKERKIYVCIPGTVEEEDIQLPVKLDFFETDKPGSTKIGTLIGHLMVTYEVWDKMDSESLAGEGNFIDTYVLDNFHKIDWI